MSSPATQLTSTRSDLVIRPIDEGERYIVKIPSGRDYFELGEQEHFLLTQLDGETDAQAVCQAFEQRFGEPLSQEDLDGFLETASAQGLLQDARATSSSAGEEGLLTSSPPRQRQSVLYWRKSLFDPDRFFNWVAPKIRFFWTRGFLILSAACVLLAFFIMWTNREQAVSSFTAAWRWETILWLWLTMFLVTLLHEFAHGLTCKHYGGEVHEIGFLLMYFMPCFYCNVSDAWLFKEKSKRLWVTFAGGYFELFLWALAVFVWRLTMPDTTINYLAFIVVVSSGVETFFNFNPLIKLDGYYLLSDWLEIPNLRQRSMEHFTAHVRRLLWGADRPERLQRGGTLLVFGMLSLAYSAFFLTLMLVFLFQYSWTSWGWPGALAVAALGVVSSRGLFHGISKGEVKKMFLWRYTRTFAWLFGLSGLGCLLAFIEIQDNVSGTVQVHSQTKAEIRAPVEGILREIHCEEGDWVSTSMVLARMEIPDLDSQLKRKEAEVVEAQARLRLLKIGTRPEKLQEQRQRVKRLQGWCELTRHHLKLQQAAFDAELTALDGYVEECLAKMKSAKETYERTLKLGPNQAASSEEMNKVKAAFQIAQAQHKKAVAEKNARQKIATIVEEKELAKREQELAEARAQLELLEAGSRPEEIQAELARLKKLQEEQYYLQQLQEKLNVHCASAGVVTTPRLKEKIGSNLNEGDVICTIQELPPVKAEIAVAEQEIGRVKVGQNVTLKFRAFPYTPFAGRVEKIAPVAETGDGQSSVTVWCHLKGSAKTGLRPGMTGYARIQTKRRPIGQIAMDRVLRYLRTEFWW